jgi:hypothetical protein
MKELITGLTYYILDKDKNVIPTHDLLKWSQFFESKDRFLFHTKIEEVEVSTVFIGLDHRFGFKEEGDLPVVFETMIFGGEHDGYTDRYCTYEEAKTGHHRIATVILKKMSPEKKTIRVVLDNFKKLFSEEKEKTTKE